MVENTTEVPSQTEPITPPQPQIEPQAKSQVLKYVLLGILGLFLLGGTTYAGYWYGAKSEKLPPKADQPLVEKPQILTPTETPAVTSTPTPNQMSNWKTYTNTKHGFSLSYPLGWLTLSPGGQYGDECIYSTDKDDIIEFTQQTLYYCGFVGDQLPNPAAELTIWVLDKPWKKEEILATDATGNDISQDIIVASEKATKTPFTEKSELPNIQATRIYFNHNDKGYLMFLKQIDKNGNYSSIFDQILSTFQFLD